MINTTSRYKTATISTVTDTHGTHQVVNPADPKGYSFEFSYYMIEDEDTIDNLADDYLGSGQLWWIIANANPEILNWSSLRVGQVIRIPSVQ